LYSFNNFNNLIRLLFQNEKTAIGLIQNYATTISLEQQIASQQLELQANAADLKSVESENRQLSKQVSKLEEEKEKLKQRIKQQNNNKRVVLYGKKYNHNDLLDTAALILNGEQFEKVESLMAITNRDFVKHTTHYRYLKVLLRVVREMFNEESDKLAKRIEELKKEDKLGSLLVSLDAAWNRRGHTSKLGNFAAILISEHADLNNKVLWQETRSFKRTKLVKGKDKIVHEGTTILFFIHSFIYLFYLNVYYFSLSLAIHILMIRQSWRLLAGDGN